jgi:hypothetical protein
MQISEDETQIIECEASKLLILNPYFTMKLLGKMFNITGHRALMGND